MENQTTHRLKHLHGDRGGEFLNNVLLQHLNSKGVRYTFSNPDSPQQNGVAEARNKASGRIITALLRQSEAPMSLWPYAAQHCCNVQLIALVEALLNPGNREVLRGSITGP